MTTQAQNTSTYLPDTGCLAMVTLLTSSSAWHATVGFDLSLVSGLESVVTFVEAGVDVAVIVDV